MQSDELTSEKSEVKKAKKSKQQLQALAEKRLAQVRDESERANNLHDELAAVLEAKAKQQATFEEYKSVVESMKSEKLNLKREFWTGRKGPGGAKWPLWVVEVCCELLVNGTPPSAVPANIATLYETLYGAEVVEYPSVAFLRDLCGNRCPKSLK